MTINPCNDFVLLEALQDIDHEIWFFKKQLEKTSDSNREEPLEKSYSYLIGVIKYAKQHYDQANSSGG